MSSDDIAAQSYPYRALTDLEQASISEPTRAEDEDSKRVVGKRSKQRTENDRLQRLNYRSGSFVSGSTRGLTGIMSGVDPRAVLEQLIREVAPRYTIDRRRNREQIPIIGTGATSISTMSSDMMTRTRPGMTLGSKQGWFSPPPPKDTDPINDERVCDLEDVATASTGRDVRMADRVRKKTLRSQRA